MKSLIKCDFMRKKTIIILLILTLAIYALNIKVQSSIEENDYSPTSLELTPHDPILIDSDSDFEDFPGLGTAEDPYLIEDYNITTTNNYGIHISGTTKYFVVRNCYVDAGEYGISISNVADGTAIVLNNTCNKSYFGIWIEDSGNSTVANNTCSNTDDNGIYLSYSDNSTVANNTCSNNRDDGISLYYSGSSTVTNNTCNNNNNWEGISFLYSGSSTVVNNTCYSNNRGITFYFSGSSTVTNNTCNINNIYGIYLWSSDFCVITYNLLQENRGYGVYLDSNSGNNFIHHNTFVDNGLGRTSQAYDDGTDNYWYDTEADEGNYWSDWSGVGSYPIDGEANSVDLYPLGEPLIVEYPQILLLTLIVSIVALFLTRTISKKTKKDKAENRRT